MNDERGLALNSPSNQRIEGKWGGFGFGFSEAVPEARTRGLVSKFEPSVRRAKLVYALLLNCSRGWGCSSSSTLLGSLFHSISERSRRQEPSSLLLSKRIWFWCMRPLGANYFTHFSSCSLMYESIRVGLTAGSERGTGELLKTGSGSRRV
jgi:hypothetical protein